jgi:ADP-heptose:LPS heptosyltransferase
MVLTSLSLRQTMALIERCAVLLCHDSGPMHLATALNVPVVALFGPTHPKLGFWPVGEENAVLTAEAACSPCSLHGTRPCSLERKICLEEISPARVTEALRRVLDREKEGADVAGGGSPLLPA